MTPEHRGREGILDTAARLFSQKGFKGVSIRDIAQACGMTNAALYYHFKNKDDLFLGVLCRDHENRMAALAEAATATGDFRNRLKQVVARYSDVMCAQRQSFHNLRRDMAHIDNAQAHKLFGEMQADFLSPIQQLLESGQAEGRIGPCDPKQLARLLYGMMISTVFESGRGYQVKVKPEDVDTLVNVFLDGAGT